MSSTERFMQEYEKMKKFMPEIYLHINESRNGGYWRIKVFSNDMAIIGDAELFTVEKDDKDEAFNLATFKLNEIPARVAELMELKSLGRKIVSKRD